MSTKEEIEAARRRVGIKHALRRAGVEWPTEIDQDERVLQETLNRHQLTAVSWEDILASRPAPERRTSAMGEAIAMSSPSGSMSKPARRAVEKRLAKLLFGEEKEQMNSSKLDIFNGLDDI